MSTSASCGGGGSKGRNAARTRHPGWHGAVVGCGASVCRSQGGTLNCGWLQRTRALKGCWATRRAWRAQQRSLESTATPSIGEEKKKRKADGQIIAETLKLSRFLSLNSKTLHSNKNWTTCLANGTRWSSSAVYECDLGGFDHSCCDHQRREARCGNRGGESTFPERIPYDPLSFRDLSIRK